MMSLRSKLIRLAHETPELREKLLPLLSKEGAQKPEYSMSYREIIRPRVSKGSWYLLFRLTIPTDATVQETIAHLKAGEQNLQKFVDTVLRQVKVALSKEFQEYRDGSFEMTKRPPIQLKTYPGQVVIETQQWVRMEWPSRLHGDGDQKLGIMREIRQEIRL